MRKLGPEAGKSGEESPSQKRLKRLSKALEQRVDSKLNKPKGITRGKPVFEQWSKERRKGGRELTHEDLRDFIVEFQGNLQEKLQDERFEMRSVIEKRDAFLEAGKVEQQWATAVDERWGNEYPDWKEKSYGVVSRTVEYREWQEASAKLETAQREYSEVAEHGGLKPNEFAQLAEEYEGLTALSQDFSYLLEGGKNAGNDVDALTEWKKTWVDLIDRGLISVEEAEAMALAGPAVAPEDAGSGLGSETRDEDAEATPPPPEKVETGPEASEAVRLMLEQFLEKFSEDTTAAPEKTEKALEKDWQAEVTKLQEGLVGKLRALLAGDAPPSIGEISDAMRSYEKASNALAAELKEVTDNARSFPHLEGKEGAEGAETLPEPVGPEAWEAFGDRKEEGTPEEKESLLEQLNHLKLLRADLLRRHDLVPVDSVSRVNFEKKLILASEIGDIARQMAPLSKKLKEVYKIEWPIQLSVAKVALDKLGAMLDLEGIDPIELEHHINAMPHEEFDRRISSALRKTEDEKAREALKDKLGVGAGGGAPKPDATEAETEDEKESRERAEEVADLWTGFFVKRPEGFLFGRKGKAEFTESLGVLAKERNINQVSGLLAESILSQGEPADGSFAPKFRELNEKIQNELRKGDGKESRINILRRTIKKVPGMLDKLNKETKGVEGGWISKKTVAAAKRLREYAS